MQGYVETLLIKDAQVAPADRARYLQIVYDSAEKLSRLVQQLFEYAQLESKDISPRKEAFFAQELAQDTLNNYRALAQAQGIELQLQAPEQLPLVFADLSLMERVLQNLLDNAMKFTPPGGRVVLSLRESRAGIEVRVQDSGQGIPEAEQAHIFDRYWQGPASAGKGAGLGLAIVKKILEIHNAAIHVQSRPGQGAAFWFQLPLFQAA
jgi:signal transduction histidine kinase